MQGKPLKAWKASRSRIAQNPWYRTLTAALGAGWGTEFRVEALRYQRVLLLCDPDADGIHIAALLSLFFWKWMQPAIQEQRVGIIQAPVAEILAPGSTAPSWVHSEEELQQVWAHHAGRSPAGGPPDFAGGRSGGAPRIHRYRGLASLNSDVLRAHCLAPDTRRERRLTAQEIQLIAQIWCGDAES